jgi:transcriptional/translational regulatory protein YebC/TACO1
VRQGGPDVLANSRLREALAAAKMAQVPNDIIERNIKKASESKADFAEMTYEAYGAGGTGFVIECLTDNVNRSAADVKTAITKGGGKVGGVVAWLADCCRDRGKGCCFRCCW